MYVELRLQWYKLLLTGILSREHRLPNSSQPVRIIQTLLSKKAADRQLAES